MGGSIRVVVKVDECLYVATTHTNGLPYFVFDSRFVEANKEYIQAFLDEWSFIGHGKEGADALAPYAYGLDIYDFDSHTIYTMQNYCGYDYRHYASYSLDIAQDREQKAIYEGLWNKKYMGLYLIKDIDDGLYNTDNKVLHTVDDITLTEAAKRIEKDNESYHRKRKNVYLFFNMLWEQAGWKHSRYSEDYQGAKEFFETIYSQYILTEDDIMCWHNSIESFEIE